MELQQSHKTLKPIKEIYTSKRLSLILHCYNLSNMILNIVLSANNFVLIIINED
jgi:hypothetical protein